MHVSAYIMICTAHFADVVLGQHFGLGKLTRTGCGSEHDVNIKFSAACIEFTVTVTV